MAAARASSSALLAPDGLSSHWATLWVSLWLATAGNVALWQQLLDLPELANPRGLVFALAFGVIIAGATCALLTLLAWRWTFKPAAVLFLLSAAGGAHFMMAYRVVLDPSMMVNVLQTQPREVGELMSARFFITMTLLGLLPSLWVWHRPIQFQSAGRQLLRNGLQLLLSLAVVVLALVLSFQSFASTMRNHTQLRYMINPLNSFFSLGFIASSPLRMDTRELLPIGQDVKLGQRLAAPAKPPLLVLVLGETCRRGNFSLTGYGRPTTPLLEKQNVVSQRNTVSCGTNTAASVPCMFSHLGKDGFESRKHNFENLLDVLQRAGLAVLWLDNQTGCKGVCDRVPNASTTALAVPGLCVDGECFDEVMLHDLDQRLAALDPARRARGTVLVLHQMGSHGPAYYRRSPAALKRFQPECTSNNLQDCSHEALVNAYDNTIAYTDHFLNATLTWLQAQQRWAAPAMLYVADHGESLGENNLYLHGLPYAIAPAVQKEVPWITWLSPAFEAQRGTRMACLLQHRDVPLSHDNYFHSVLGLLELSTALYRPALDLYARCTAPTPAPGH